MASFSNQVKSEICGSIRKAADCRAFLAGALLAVRRFSADEIVLQTECEAFAGLLPQLIRNAAPKLRYDTEFRRRAGKQPVWCFSFGKAEANALTAALHLDPADRAAGLETYGGAAAKTVAGVFVMSGSMTDPERAYHLEMVMPDADFGNALREIFAELPGIPLKSTERKGDMILYLKQNMQICDALTFFGAKNASMSLAEQQVYKSIRSQTNRRLNCDLANIDKSVIAGEQQVADIRLIQQTVGLSALPENLREIAGLRLADPEASLRELGTQCQPPLSRSGVNHRLQKISAIAEQLKKQQ